MTTKTIANTAPPGRRYFGTDGIRGRVGGKLVNPEFMLKLGWATGRALAENKRAADGHPKVVIGKDTRISGYMLESALEAGFSAAGVDVLLSGPVPSPAVAYLTRTLSADFGIVISASHNPHHDNGVKLFNASGHKLSDDTERTIERFIDLPLRTAPSKALGKASRIDNADARYIEFCKSSLPPEVGFSGLRLVVDCAHGAAYHIAPKVFAELGAEVVSIGTEPDGLNINLRCGAIHLDALRAQVLQHNADAGIALDGDADRIMMVDRQGGTVDGDRILYIIARQRVDAGAETGPIVGTLMSNLGLEQAVGRLGPAFIRADVGDRHVMRRMTREGAMLGGEPSGHVICFDKTSTGDGIIAALQVLHAMTIEKAALSELAAAMTVYPQVLLNVPAPRLLSQADLAPVARHLEAAQKSLPDGRVLLRPSGTEPVVRIMTEGRDREQIETVARRLADQVKAAL